MLLTRSSQDSQGPPPGSQPFEIVPFTEPLTSQQVYETLKKVKKDKGIYLPPKKMQSNYAPFLSLSNNEFLILFDPSPPLSYAATNHSHIVFNLTGSIEVPRFVKNELDIFNQIYKNFTNFGFNSTYSRSYHIVRNINSMISMKKSKSSIRYQDFIKEIEKVVYTSLYKLPFISQRFDFAEIQNKKPADLIDFKEEEAFIAYDLLSDPLMAIVISLQEALDKITDDEINNLFVLCSHNFVSPINWLLSPMAVALSFFHMQLLQMKKPQREDNYYSKSNLPKVTYLSLTGLFSELDIDVLNAYSDNVQMIQIYDEHTGGPRQIHGKGEYSGESSFRTSDSSIFHKINKLLLIPLKCSQSGKPEYKPNDLLTIIEDIVVRSIEKFKPAYIVLNCSLIFDKDSNLPFWLDEVTFGHIVHLLCQLCDNKVLIFPFKLPNKPPEDSQDRNLLYDGIQRFISKKHITPEMKTQFKTRLDYIWERYFIPYNEVYVRNCFVQAFEALSGLRDSNLFNAQHLKNKSGINPLVNKMLYQITRYYKQHPYYGFLYSKSFAPLARAATNHLQSLDKITSASSSTNITINSIPIYSAQKSVSMVKLSTNAENGTAREIVLDENSQYYVDYSSDSPSPNIYIFNARIFQVSNEQKLKVHEQLGHFKVSVEFEDLNSSYSLSDSLSISAESNPEIPEILRDSGLCQVGPYIFQVYGTNTETQKDTTSIYYHNFEDKKSFKIKIKESYELLPRHSVTTCAFQKYGKYYLYIFGGQIQPNTKFGSRTLKALDIIDVIEVYSTSNPQSGEWNYRMLKKEDKPKENVFIPYNKSFAFYQKYNEEKESIIIMGGEIFKQSCFQWTFPVFEFDLLKETFYPYQIYVTDFKENPQRKTIINNQYKRPVVTVAVADINKNFSIDMKNKTATFLIPGKEDNLYSVCSYNWEKRECEYEQIQLKKEVEKAPAVRDNATKVKTTPISQRLTTKIAYTASSNLEKYLFDQLLYLIIDLNGNTEDWNIKLTMKIEAREDLTQEAKDYLIEEKDKMADKFDILLNDKEFVEIIKADDHRRRIVQSYLKITEENSEESKKSNLESQAKPAEEVQVQKTRVVEKINRVITKLTNFNNSNMSLSSSFGLYDSLSTAVTLKPTFLSFSSNKDILSQHNAYSEEENKFTQNLDQIEKILDQEPDRVNATLNNTDKSSFHNQSRGLVDVQTQLIRVRDVISTKDNSKIDFSKANDLLEEVYKSFDSSKRSEINDSQLSNKGNSLADASMILKDLHQKDAEEELKPDLDPIPESSQKEDEIVGKAESPRSQNSQPLQDSQEDKPTEEEKYTIIPPKEEEKKPQTITPIDIKHREPDKEPPTPRKQEEETKRQTVLYRSVEVQVDLSEGREDEQTTDSTNQFKEGLQKPSPYRVFFNGSKSGLVVSDPNIPEGDGIYLRFKVKKPGFHPYEDISFEFSPSSVDICGNIVVCYIDNKFKIRYPEIFYEYKNWVLYADIESSLNLCKQDGKNYLVFKKLFLITHSDHILNRCLVINTNILGLFGGSVYRLKGKKSSSDSKDFSIYNFDKFFSIGQISNEFRDTGGDDTMDQIQGECIAIKTKNNIFLCSKLNPSCIEIIKTDATLVDTIDLPTQFKDYFVHTNLVNFRNKDEILISFFKQDKNFEFLLYDINAQEFEEDKVSLVPRDSSNNEKFQTIYSGFEQFEHNSSPEKPLQNILIHSFRAETPKLVPCDIKVGT